MKMKMLTFTSLALVACLAAVSPARAQQTRDIVDTAVAIHVIDRVLLPPGE
jgi:hypothetical protein